MALNELELLCIGNALVDVFARGDGDLCARYGLTLPVQHIEIEKLKRFLSMLPAMLPAADVSSGGGAANVAKIAALLGAKVRFIGALGIQEASQPDEFGRLFEKSLSSAGVELRLPLKNAPTGICLYFNTGAETRIAASPSAALQLSESDIADEDIRRARLVVIDGFILERTGLVRHILRLAEQYKITAAIDLGSAAIAENQAMEIVNYARQYPLILFMNEAEAEAFYDGLGPDQRLPEPCAEDAKQKGTEPLLLTGERRKTGSRLRSICSFFRSFTKGELKPVIVVKLGKRGAVAFAEGSIYRAATTAMIPHESTGAGDAFAATFLTAWVRNKSISECAALGNNTARILLEVPGTQVDKKKLESIAQQMRINQ